MRDGITCGGEAVTWWEVEGPRNGDGVDVLTVWEPAWSAARQVRTFGIGEQFSAGGGWLAWFEYADDMSTGRIRAVPLSVLGGA